MKKLSWDGKNGPLLIAEIGGNHEGDFAYAKRLTKLAIKSEEDIIKKKKWAKLTIEIEKESHYVTAKSYKKIKQGVRDVKLKN